MSARGHSLTDAEEATAAGLGTISRVLSGKRGVGMDLAAKILAAYPEVPIASWAQQAPAGATLASIPRGRTGPRSEAS